MQSWQRFIWWWCAKCSRSTGSERGCTEGVTEFILWWCVKCSPSTGSERGCTEGVGVRSAATPLVGGGPPCDWDTPRHTALLFLHQVEGNLEKKNGGGGVGEGRGWGGEGRVLAVIHAIESEVGMYKMAVQPRFQSCNLLWPSSLWMILAQCCAQSCFRFCDSSWHISLSMGHEGIYVNKQGGV